MDTAKYYLCANHRCRRTPYPRNSHGGVDIPKTPLIVSKGHLRTMDPGKSHLKIQWTSVTIYLTIKTQTNPREIKFNTNPFIYMIFQDPGIGMELNLQCSSNRVAPNHILHLRPKPTSTCSCVLSSSPMSSEQLITQNSYPSSVQCTMYIYLNKCIHP